jgi:hypothetical protein
MADHKVSSTKDFAYMGMSVVHDVDSIPSDIRNNEEIDITDDMDNQGTGMYFQVELSGYIVRKGNHFISINKCVSGVHFYCNSFAAKIGRHQNDNWETLMFLFYTVKRGFILVARRNISPR